MKENNIFLGKRNKYCTASGKQIQHQEMKLAVNEETENFVHNIKKLQKYCTFKSIIIM